MLPAYKETYTYYATPSENTKILIYRRRKASNQDIKRKAYFKKQRFCGILMTSIGIIAPIALADATISFITLPLGLFLMFTKEKVMMFE